MMDLETKLLGFAARSLADRITLVAELTMANGSPIALGTGNVRTTARENDALPLALRLFHEALPPVASRFTQNRILAPNEIRSVGDKLIFAVENQGAYSWATAASGDDPPVFGRFEDTDPWVAEESQLTLFLLQFVLFERLMCLPHGASVAWVDPAPLRAILGDLTLLPFPPWRWPSYPARFHVRGEALGFECPNAEGAHSLWVAAPEPKDVAFMRPHIGAEWEHIAL